MHLMYICNIFINISYEIWVRSFSNISLNARSFFCNAKAFIFFLRYKYIYRLLIRERAFGSGHDGFLIDLYFFFDDFISQHILIFFRVCVFFFTPSSVATLINRSGGGWLKRNRWQAKRFSVEQCELRCDSFHFQVVLFR